MTLRSRVGYFASHPAENPVVLDQMQNRNLKKKIDRLNRRRCEQTSKAENPPEASRRSIHASDARKIGTIQQKLDSSESDTSGESKIDLFLEASGYL